MHHLLDDKVCLVTGASRGIGKAIALHFAREGALVYANARDGDVLNAWITDEGLEGSVLPLVFDVADTEKAKEAVLRIKNEQKRLDVLVNNAAVEKNERIGMITRQSMQSMFEINVYAALELLQMTARVMQRSKSGSIINIVSKVGDRGNAGQLVYSATKGALIAATKSAAKELASSGIRVNAVAPGLTDTDMYRNVAPEVMEERLRNICMGRLAEPAEIADACVFLASDLSRFVSGHVLAVDGCTIL